MGKLTMGSRCDARRAPIPLHASADAPARQDMGFVRVMASRRLGDREQLRALDEELAEFTRSPAAEDQLVRDAFSRLFAAQRLQIEGQVPLPREREIVGGHPRLSEAYYERQRELARQVDRARVALARARERRARGRDGEPGAGAV